MNKAFNKYKLVKWYGSRFYKSCIGPSTTYSKWIYMQPKSVIEHIYGKGCILNGEIVPI